MEKYLKEKKAEFQNKETPPLRFDVLLFFISQLSSS
jgi:hypothetical protein